MRVNETHADPDMIRGLSAPAVEYSGYSQREKALAVLWAETEMA